jgi:hypothetical protein
VVFIKRPWASKQRKSTHCRNTADALDAVQTFRRECCFAARPSDGH